VAFHTIEDGPWPKGTTVVAWPAASVVGGVPTGAAVSSGVASANGVVELGGLTEGASYTAFGHGGSQTFVAMNEEARFAAIESRNGINVKAAPYLAAGDGVTDDTAAIQAAISAAAVNLGKGGCDVILPAGTYLISSALLMKYNTRLIGQSGRGATMLKAITSGTFTNGSRSAFPAMVKWDGGDGWAHGVQLKGFQLNTNNIAGLSGTWFEGPGENFLLDDLRCDLTAPVTRQVTDAQFTAGSRVVTFTSSTVTEEDVNARITTGGSVAAPAAPVPTTSTSGGSIAASKQVTVAVTYVTANGETAPSATGGVTTGAGATNKVTVPSPSALTGATGWVAYANTAGAGKLVRQGSVNAIGTPLDITTLPDGSVGYPTAVTPYQKIDYPNWAANSTETSKTTVTMREPAVATLADVTLTISRPTDAFVFDLTTVGAATGRIGFLNGVNNSGALLRFKGFQASTWLIDVLSGDDNGGGLLRISKGSITGNPANVTIGQLKAENQGYNPNFQWTMDPVVLLDRCWTVNLNVLGGAPVTTGYARDLVRLDHSWATVDVGGPAVALMGFEGQNWFNNAYTNIVRDTKSGEVVPVSPYGEQSPYPLVLWNKKLRLAGGSEVPELAPWNLFMDTGWPNAPLKYNGATAGFTSGVAGALTGRVMFSATGLQNDGFGWYVPLAKGTWNLAANLWQDSTSGIVTLDISYDGGATFTTIGTVDLYFATARQGLATFQGIVVPKTCRAILRSRVLTRNASASGWQQGYTAFTWSRIS
jgi:hypothetical protein